MALPELALAASIVLLIALASTQLSKSTGLPTNIFLVITAISLSILNQVFPFPGLETIKPFLPDFVSGFILPILIFEISTQLQIRVVKRAWSPALAVTVAGIFVLSFSVGYSFRALFGLSLLPALVFGAIICTSDPKAISDLFRRSGAPRRLTEIMTSESIFATFGSIALFSAFYGMVATNTYGFDAISIGIIKLAKAVLVGFVTGIALGYSFAFLLRVVTDNAAAQLGLTVVAAYVSYQIPGIFLNMNGVLATAVTGFIVSSKAQMELRPETLEAKNQLWQLLSYVGNALVFLIAGLTLDIKIFKSSAQLLPAALGVIYFGRVLAVMLPVTALNLWGTRDQIPLSQQTNMIWGTLRGGLTIALLISLPDEFPNKALYTAIAFSLVLTNLLVNGVTTPFILKSFKLTETQPIDLLFCKTALKSVKENVFGPLEKMAASGGLSWTMIDNQQSHFSDNLTTSYDAGSADRFSSLRFAANTFLLDERAHYETKYAEGAISRRAFLRLTQSADERSEILDLGGAEGLKNYRLNFVEDNMRANWLTKVLSKFPAFRMQQLSMNLEVLLNLRICMSDLFEHIDNEEFRRIVDLWLKTIDHKIEQFFHSYPTYGIAVQADFSANALRASARSTIGRLANASIISPTAEVETLSQIDETHRNFTHEARKLLNPSIPFLLSRTPLFQNLQKPIIEMVAARGRRKRLRPESIVVTEGDVGGSFYLVLSGMLEVRSSTKVGTPKPRLFTGDFLGEMALLYKQPRNATVVAVISSEVFEIDEDTFQSLLGASPELRAKIEATAAERSGHQLAASPDL